MMTISRRWCFLTIALGVLAFTIGLLIGLFAPERYGSRSDILLKRLTKDADPYVSRNLISEVNAANIDKHLKILTSQPHLAGTSGNLRTVEYVRDQWKEQGYEVEMVPYDVLLSYPASSHINTASLMGSDGSILFQTAPNEHAYYTAESHPNVVQPYNAFSPSGQPEADLVYANYARDVDFENLTRLGVNVTGKIVIARYGKIFRGNKVLFAHKYGAAGIILFMDPGDYTDGDVTYPDTIWLPRTGVQRGNIVMIKGDQATPGYPAVWYTARLTQDELAAKLPKIPSHPISYGDAYMLLREMEGASAPQDWQGGLNITYKLGGTMKSNMKVKLNIKNELRTVTVYNIIAKMKGHVESDKAVLIGNHNDAWVFGGADPSSGTAALLEMSRVYAEEVRKGWEPRRSVIFCSWDAEEFGLVGSFEWVEDNVKWLQRQAVAYLNMDSLSSGNYSFSVAATPSLNQAVFRAAKKVPDPDVKGQNMYDVWKVRHPGVGGQPSVRLPGAGTDFLPFEQDVAIPTIDSDYRSIVVGDKVYKSTGSPLYHTLYDGYRLHTMMDPGFQRSKAVAAFLLEVTRDLVDSALLPLDVRDYAKEIENFVHTLLAKERERFLQHNITSDGIQSASRNFTEAANRFNIIMGNVDKEDPLAVRSINDKLMALDKAFQVPTGLPGREEYKHVLLSPSRANYYQTTTFPGIADLLYQIGNDPARWEQVRKHLSVLTFTIQSAAKILLT